MENYDVVIIGAGLAGLRCAQLLGRQGHSVLLVDCKRTLHDSIHATGIFVRRTLEGFAIPDDCLGPPIRDIRLYTTARRRADFDGHSVAIHFGYRSLLI